MPTVAIASFHGILVQNTNKNMSCLVSKNFQDFLSNRIFKRIHRALNIDKI